MSRLVPGQMPLSRFGARKTELRVQFAALPWRRDAKGRVRILLVTSRNTGRWIVPKGWPTDGVTPARSAAREAWEEAGVEGRASDLCLGLYSYAKDMEGTRSDLPVAVALFPLEVTSLAERWPEASERRRAWSRRRKAAARVDEVELAAIIRAFDPDALGL